MRLVQALSEAFPGLRCSEHEPDRVAYARDLWPRHHIAVRSGRVADYRPTAVAWPERSEQVAALVAWCAAEGVSIVPYGAGSGVCAGVLPTDQVLVLDLKRMRSWRNLDREAGLLDVEAGVMGIRLEEELEPLGYTVGHFPSSILCSTVGGWVAARGAGQCSGRYGKIEDMVAALECVDGRGELATLQRRTHGPDLTPLWIGCEGVLGVITSATLRLHPSPAHRAFLGMSFPTMKAGYDTIRQMYQTGLRPAVCRLYDPFDSMMARRSAAKRARRSGRPKRDSWFKRLAPGLEASAVGKLLRIPGALNATIDALGSRVFGGAMLVLVFEGEQALSCAQLEQARTLGLAAGATDLGEGPARHWLAHRYSVSYRQAPIFMAGAFADTMEVAAPWSCFDALYNDVRKALGEHVMVMAHMSHAYPDGCSIYFTFAASAGDDAGCERIYDAAWSDAMQAAIEAGGTLSHHHGVGRSKAPMMGAELGLGVNVVLALRKAADPAGILNPGNLMPREQPPRWPLPQLPERPELLLEDQLVHSSGTATLAEVEHTLTPHGLSLGLGSDAPDIERTSVADWIATGAPGAPDPWHDPVDHLLAGFSIELSSGAPLVIRPCPRRAVGPDLYALFHGTEGRAGRVHSAHLRARHAGVVPLETAVQRNPAVSDAEKCWLDRAIDATATVD